MNKKNIYKECIELWGWRSELIVLMEEMNELGKVICKMLREDAPDCVILNDKLYEEIADVEIMIEQIKDFFECEKDIDLIKIEKLERLEKRIKRYKLNEKK